MTRPPFVPWPEELVLVLASASPRRADLLRIAGVPYEIAVAPEAAESAVAARLDRVDPARYATALAAAKAEAVAADRPGRLVLGADTVVVLDGDILEKPVDADDAVRMLTRLQGRRHTVITAVALRGAEAGPLDAAERTEVEFLPLTPAAVAAYVATGEPMDKAGAYGIQGYGAMMVRRVEGCYFNVMGLPLARLGELLRRAVAVPQKGGRS